MSRSCSWNGLPDIAYGLVKELESKQYMTEEYYFQEYPMFEYYENGVLKFKEVEQITLWDGGPNVFLKLVDAEGKDVIVWDESTIKDMLGWHDGWD